MVRPVHAHSRVMRKARLTLDQPRACWREAFSAVVRVSIRFSRQGVRPRGHVDLGQQLPQDRSSWEASAKTEACEGSPEADSSATNHPVLPERQGRHRLGSSEESYTPRPSEWPQTQGVVTLPKTAEDTAALWNQELAPSTHANPPEGRSSRQEPSFKKTSSAKLRPSHNPRQTLTG